jgi:acyl-CoA synthetase (AMP-forming)/AMP-acid ligase II
MRRAAEFNADCLAIVSGDRSLTFREAWGRGLRFANAMLALGLEAGDRVAVLEDNCFEASDFFLGTAAANLVRVPLYRRNSREAHGHMLRNTGCRAIVVSAEYLHEVEGLEKEIDGLEFVVIRDEGYEEWLAGYPDTDPDPKVDLDDLYVIRHSGGTTGTPKGMAFTHRQWLSTGRDWTYLLPPIKRGDACTHAAPISHGSGYFFVPVWLAGAYNILVPKFSADYVLDQLSERGGYFFAVPTMISDMLAAGQKGRSFDKLKAIIISGAPIRPQTSIAAMQMLGDKLHQLYGQTEATPVVWMGPGEWFADIPGSEPLLSVGRVHPFAGVEIRDDENHLLPIGEIGEVAIKNESQITGIWNDPELSRQRIVDGWILTGDIGRLDQNGFLYLVDRKDDMIISGGMNIWPAELELVISALPGVREVAVVSAPDPRFGEKPVAVVVLNEGATLEEARVIDECAKRLGAYKKPGCVVIQYDPLPRTPVGKIQRKAVRAGFWQGQENVIGGS